MGSGGGGELRGGEGEGGREGSGKRLIDRERGGGR